ncbi:MAG: conjugal transfer protein TraI [Mesorhizobium sp.]|uniref:acyl-homoserine-lactone synthase n=1 Tax=Mesorhizobium sp. TaxID=1871066 RepID=UPI001220E47B|nr:acyl-homoserine-lactone synthase [Mesorhizobium sp.]TIU72454.1 MAG: conjugal transfer protein TraI [Mesorhizobium sp.]TIW14130.1 MAG: conjugal transfer protein TraI [Mesorhizobium sp.]TIX73406.1 MAG: conjugal transfer protein TraI [Mesorhizobium sp.]
MMQLITPDCYSQFTEELEEMHRLRHRVFRDRLNWDVSVSGGYEVDTYDALGPCYLLLRSSSGRVDGCVRLLPTAGPTMLRDSFSILLGGRQAPEDPRIWESSRFALDLPSSAPKEAGIALGTYELFAGMLEFGLSHDLTSIVTVTDLRIERILRRAGWPLERLSDPETIGNTRAIAGYLGVSADNLAAIRRNGGIKGPVLWAPVMKVA